MEEEDVLDKAQLQEKLRNEFGWRVGEHTAGYILGRLSGSKRGKPFPILASDARTGQAIRPVIDPEALDESQPVQFLLFPT